MRAEAAEGTPIIGTFYAWWRGDPLPELSELSGLVVTADPSPAAVERLVALPEREVTARLLAAHRPYLAALGGEAAALGWCALRRFGIGERGLGRALPPGDAYLWDFRTMRPWRGRGIYPRLLQYILRDATLAVERFWIGHDLDNFASERGILKAGFRPVG